MKTMKIIIPAIAVSAMIMLSSCKNNDKKQEEVSSGQSNLHDVELSSVRARDSIETVYQTTLNEIANNLISIRENHSLVAMHPLKSSDRNISKKEEILENIKIISDQLAENKAKIEKLHARIASYKMERNRSKKENEEMKAFIEQKEKDIEVLNREIDEQYYSITSLNKQVQDLNAENAEIRDQAKTAAGKADKELHTAYFTMGTPKELKKHNVIKKEGGVLGIGAVDELKPDFEPTYFTRIDTRAVTSIPVSSKKAKLVTHHPVGSYEWGKVGKNVEYLTITNPDKFWESSKYLVVEVK